MGPLEFVEEIRNRNLDLIYRIVKKQDIFGERNLTKDHGPFFTIDLSEKDINLDKRRRQPIERDYSGKESRK